MPKGFPPSPVLVESQPVTIERHGITTAWIDGQKHRRDVIPTSWLSMRRARKALIEAQDPSRLDSDDVLRKRKAAELWCKQRHMEYMIAPIG